MTIVWVVMFTIHGWVGTPVNQDTVVRNNCIQAVLPTKAWALRVAARDQKQHIPPPTGCIPGKVPPLNT